MKLVVGSKKESKIFKFSLFQKKIMIGNFWFWAKNAPKLQKLFKKWPKHQIVLLSFTFHYKKKSTFWRWHFFWTLDMELPGKKILTPWQPSPPPSPFITITKTTTSCPYLGPVLWFCAWHSRICHFLLHKYLWRNTLFVSLRHNRISLSQSVGQSVSQSENRKQKPKWKQKC